jgi:ectoine hydroxylase-related dioxygenase (phytanoyl-CoA dioxygenase family)
MSRHALNEGFEWRDHSGPFRVLSDEQARQFDESGYLVLEDVFDAETIADLIADIDPIEAAFESIIREKFDGRVFIARAGEITFTTHIVTRSEKARAFTRCAFFRDLCHDLLGPDVRLYWDQAVYKKPGTLDPFPWHQDNGYTYVEPQQYLTCWVALTDADEQNGCPWVIPGIHREGTRAHEMTELGWNCFAEDPGEGVPAPVRAGGVVVFSSLTPHKTGPNTTTDAHRKSYIVQFAPDGAEVLSVADGELRRVSCDAPERQYPVLTAGEAPSS